MRHAFLAALESSGCVGPGTGWAPSHATLWEGDTLRAAAPLYLKSHSWGEYVFDWAWAEAYARHGAETIIPNGYAQSPSRRCLARDSWRAMTAPALRSCRPCWRMSQQAAAVRFSCCSRKQTCLINRPDLMQRHGVQFHWHNKGYRHFEDFLAGMSHDKRKKIRQAQRARLKRSGTTLESTLGRH